MDEDDSLERIEQELLVCAHEAECAEVTGFADSLRDWASRLALLRAVPPAPQLTEAEVQGLRDYVQWHGAAHAEGCPADDTCDCICKPLNDAVNSILRKDFDARVSAVPPAPEPRWLDIASAPKDRVIIGALIRDGKVWRVHEMKHNGLAFYTVAGGSLPRMTHWMPLPAPPEGSAP